LLVLIAVPLTTSSLLLIQQRSREREVLAAARDWADEYGWEVISVTTLEGETVVRVAGPLPTPDPQSLREAIEATGADVSAVRAEFIPAESVDFGDGG
jgi:hypothetical protein